MLGKIVRRFALITFFLMSGLYLLALPSFAVMAGVANIIELTEVIFCALLSFTNFAWASKLTFEVLRFKK